MGFAATLVVARMNVDRKKFLHLVTAIAASTVACGTKPEPQAAIIVPVQPPQDASAPVATTPSTGPSRAEEIESTPEEPTRPSAPVASSPGGIWTLPYDPSAKAKSCADLKCPGPTQEAMGALRGACRSIEKRLATEPFQRFMTCMMSHNNTRNTCDLIKVSERPGDCLYGWYDTPTINASSAAKCKPIVARCSGANRSIHASHAITQDECQKILSVTNPKSEAKMIHCVTEYCGEALTLCHGSYG